MYNIHNVVSYGFPIDDSVFTYNAATGTSADHVGRAVALDTSATNQVKPAGDGDEIFGRVFQFEDRTQQGIGLVASVQRKFKELLPIADAAVVNVGDSVVGAGDGFIKAAAAPNNTVVVELVTIGGDAFAAVESL